jgi:hypothetical protein
MPQFGLLVIIVIIPLQLLSRGFTACESMPQAVQDIMLGAPTTHFVMLAQADLVSRRRFRSRVAAVHCDLAHYHYSVRSCVIPLPQVNR